MEKIQPSFKALKLSLSLWVPRLSHVDLLRKNTLQNFFLMGEEAAFLISCPVLVDGGPVAREKTSSVYR